MGGKWLIDADRDRLSGWPETILERELIDSFTLTEPDLQLISERRRDANRLGFAIRLCALRFLGFSPRPQSPVPEEVIGFLASQLGVPPEDHEAYAARRPTRAEHEGIILEALGFRRQTSQDRHETLVWLTGRALEHDRPLVLLTYEHEPYVMCQVRSEPCGPPLP
jgi:TnpA family transposase